MSKEMSIIVLGLLVLVTPYLGLPGSWKTVIFVLAGVAIAIVGFLLRGEALARGGVKTNERHPFVENSPSRQEHTAHDQTHGISSLN